VPVLVTAAHRPLPRRLAARLLEEGGEVRVAAWGDVSSLRAAGAFVVAGTPDDEGRLEAALAEVHTVVHVGGGLHTRDPDATIAEAEVVAAAAENAGVRRLIALSLPGADTEAGEPLRRAKGEIEARFAAANPPSVVIRVSLLDTPATRDALATAGFAADVLDTEVAPVRVTDLLELVVAFDRARGQASHGHLVVSADGPQRCTIADHLRRIGVTGPGRGSLVGRRFADPARTPLLSGALTGGPWWTDDPAILDGWRFAGIEPGTPGPVDR
jgi:uncharacterized protein YbjT (DUF2867 family)